MTNSEIEMLINIQYTKKMNAENKLASSDYKVIKNAEAATLGIVLPYNTQELHNTRQSLRDTINDCIAEIERLKGLITEDEADEEVNEE